MNQQIREKAHFLLGGVEPSPQWTRIDVVLVAALALLALALRLPGLNQGLWIDEIYTAMDFVRSSAWDIISRPGEMNNHVLYSLSAHVSTLWFGESAWSLRFPALVFGVAAIPLIYLLGRQVASRPEAFLAALFLAVNYQFIWYSQSARGYTGLLAGALLSTILFIRLAGSPNPPARLIAGYALVASLTTWIHLTAVCVIVVHGLVWLSLAARQVASQRGSEAKPALYAFLWTAFLIFIFYLPMLFEEKIQHAARGAASLIELRPPPSTNWALAEFLRGLEYSMPGGIAAVLLLSFVLVAGTVSYARQDRRVAGLLLLPLLVTFVLVWERGAVLFPRFSIGSSGFLLLVGVRGGFALAGLALPFLSRRVVLAAGILMALATLSMAPRAWQPKQDFEAAARYLQQNRQPGDIVICVAAAFRALGSYYGVDCIRARNEAALAPYEHLQQRTWLVYTLPRFFFGAFPGLDKNAAGIPGFRLAAEFPGTLGDGNVRVLLRERPTVESGATGDFPQAILNSERIRQRFGSYGVELLEQDAHYRVSSLFSRANEATTTRTLAVTLISGERPEAATAERQAIADGSSIGEVFKNAGWAIEKADLYFGELAASADYGNLYSMMGNIAPQGLAVHAYDLWVSKDSERFRYATVVEIHHPDYLGLSELRQIYPTGNASPAAETDTTRELLDEVDTYLRRLPPPAPAGSAPGTAYLFRPSGVMPGSGALAQTDSLGLNSSSSWRWTS